MKKKIKKPKGMFSMNDVFNEEHKYDCREVVFGGWEAATMKSRNQGFGWHLFTLPKTEPNVNQPIPIDYKKPYHPTIVDYKNYQLSDTSSLNDDDSFTYSVLMTCPKVSFGSYSKRAESVTTPRSTSRYSNLPNNCLYDFSNDLVNNEISNRNSSMNIKKRPKTSNERQRKQSPTEILTSNYVSKSFNFNSNLNLTKRPENFNRTISKSSRSTIENDLKSQTTGKSELTNKSDGHNNNSKFHTCSLNQMVRMPPKHQMVQRLKGDNPNRFPFRMSVSVLNEYAKEQQEKENKKKPKSKVSKRKKANSSVLSLTPRSQSTVSNVSD